MVKKMDQQVLISCVPVQGTDPPRDQSKRCRRAANLPWDPRLAANLPRQSRQTQAGARTSQAGVQTSPRQPRGRARRAATPPLARANHRLTDGRPALAWAGSSKTANCASTSDAPRLARRMRGQALSVRGPGGNHLAMMMCPGSDPLWPNHRLHHAPQPQKIRIRHRLLTLQILEPCMVKEICPRGNNKVIIYFLVS